MTLTPEALASDDPPGHPPRSDVRWYHPRGAAVVAYRRGRPHPADGAAPPRVHGAVKAYLRAMALAT